MSRLRVLAVAVTLVLLAVACGDDDTDGASGDTGTTSSTVSPTSEAPGSTETETDTPTTSTAPETTAAPEPALDLTGDLAMVNWDAVTDTYIPAAGTAEDPYFHVHSSNDADGFFLSLELYTVWGQAWTGETGTFAISCGDPVAGTGICAHFDPDGPGPLTDLGEDFAATGTVVVNQLDEGGYDLVVQDLSFSDGTTFAEFTMSG